MYDLRKLNESVERLFQILLPPLHCKDGIQETKLSVCQRQLAHDRRPCNCERAFNGSIQDMHCQQVCLNCIGVCLAPGTLVQLYLYGGGLIVLKSKLFNDAVMRM